MSRRRQERRDRKRELARQLGDQAEDAPADLREKQRVTRVELRLESVEVEKAPRRLVGKNPIELAAAVALVDPTGPRWIRGLSATGQGGEKAGATIELGMGSKEGEEPGGERLRYARPASFVVLVARGMEPIAVGEAGALRIDVEGRELGLEDKALLHRPAGEPFAVTLRAESGARPAAGLVFPAVHRIKEEVAIPLAGARRSWVVRGRFSA